jgi:hypothetical protein
LVTTLDGIERQTGLRELNLVGVSVADYSPLLSLPNLESLMIDLIDRPVLLSLPQPLPFEVTYNR